MGWRDLLPRDSVVVLASTGTFELEEGPPQLGTLVLTHDKLYIMVNKSVSLQPWLQADVPLSDVHSLKVSDGMIRSLEFDINFDGNLKHKRFISLDADVKDILDKIAYEKDNPRPKN